MRSVYIMIIPESIGLMLNIIAGHTGQARREEGGEGGDVNVIVSHHLLIGSKAVGGRKEGGRIKRSCL